MRGEKGVNLLLHLCSLLSVLTFVHNNIDVHVDAGEYLRLCLKDVRWIEKYLILLTWGVAADTQVGMTNFVDDVTM